MAEPSAERFGPRPFEGRAPRGTFGYTFHKRGDSCTENFNDLAPKITTLLNEPGTNVERYERALQQLRRCFDDRFWFQRFPTYCGKWMDDIHFKQTRKILQLYYTLGLLRINKIARPSGWVGQWPPLAETMEIQHVESADASEFRIFRRDKGGDKSLALTVNHEGFTPRHTVGINKPPDVTNAIDVYQEYQPFGKIFMHPFTGCPGGGVAHTWPEEKTIRFDVIPKPLPGAKVFEPAANRRPVMPTADNVDVILQRQRNITAANARKAAAAAAAAAAANAAAAHPNAAAGAPAPAPAPAAAAAAKASPFKLSADAPSFIPSKAAPAAAVVLPPAIVYGAAPAAAAATADAENKDWHEVGRNGRPVEARPAAAAARGRDRGRGRGRGRGGRGGGTRKRKGTRKNKTRSRK